jgi:hypothetical protein
MRWAGIIGYSREEEVRPGIWEDVITEVEAFGEVQNTTAALRDGDGVLPTATVTTAISVITNGSRVPLSGIRYVTYSGVRWQIASAVHQPPRYVIYLGEEYHGPTPGSTPDTP